MLGAGVGRLRGNLDFTASGWGFEALGVGSCWRPGWHRLLGKVLGSGEGEGRQAGAHIGDASWLGLRGGLSIPLKQFSWKKQEKSFKKCLK